jgi:hypothetical protein
MAFICRLLLEGNGEQAFAAQNMLILAAEALKIIFLQLVLAALRTFNILLGEVNLF